jgi:putative ABC transport system permease protein
VSAIFGALGEAWAEVRHHKLRVLLSLIGITVAVTALAVAVSFGQLLRQFQVEQQERFGGRAATLSIDIIPTGGSGAGFVGVMNPSGGLNLSVPPAAGGGGGADWRVIDERFAAVAERYGFSHVSRVVRGFTVDVQAPDFLQPTEAALIDPAYPIIHRTALETGRWFIPEDLQLLAPPVVITSGLWQVYGSPPMDTHPTITLGGPAGGTYQVIGVTPPQFQGDTQKQITLLYDDYVARLDVLPEGMSVVRQVWVPEDQAAEIGPVLAMDLRAAFGDGYSVSVSRTDAGAFVGFEAGIAVFSIITNGAAGIVLALGGLGLLNIQLVAMRQRIREIGVRRSFGATAGRIFTSVLLENVVAAGVAGVVGVAIAIVLMRSPLPTQLFPLQDVPAFPLEAALTGMIAAVGIGALAGFLPALAAVRAKVIDALRF